MTVDALAAIVHRVNTRTIEADVLIVGGGIAGLWTLCALREAGLGALLVEKTALGGEQTVASQGIIHGGVKYALSGEASRASASIAEMPERWRTSLRAERAPDLSRAATLSDHCLLWTAPGVGGRLMGLAASKAIRVRPERLTGDARPVPFREAPTGVDVYRLDEPVLDVPSVTTALADACPGAIARGTPSAFEHDGVTIKHSAGSVRVRARWIVLTAGAGNESLLRDAAMLADAPTNESAGESADAIRMQRRPLHMVLARGDLPRIFGHAVGLKSVPLATITSTAGNEGETVWYLGGQVAETGVDRDPAAQIDAARAEVRRLLPWINTGEVEWATLRVDRAEGLTPDGSRPEGPVVRRAGRVLACWPTKLAFAPRVAELVLEELDRGGHAGCTWPEEIERAPVASWPWLRLPEEGGVTWS